MIEVPGVVAVHQDHVQTEIAGRFSELEGVDDVVYAERALDRVRIFLLVTQAVGLFFVGLIVLSFLFIVSNSTKLSLHTRQEEIQISPKPSTYILFIGAFSLSKDQLSCFRFIIEPFSASIIFFSSIFSSCANQL